MIGELSKLSPGEVELLYRAPLLVCILIAGADGNIDRKEIKQAINIVHKKQNGTDAVSELFKEISQDFEDKLKVLEQGYPYEATQRTPILIEEISSLNSLWPKLTKDLANGYYDILVMLAKEVATSSGGLLGINSVGSEEARLIKLSMIKNPAS